MARQVRRVIELLVEIYRGKTETVEVDKTDDTIGGGV